MDTIDTDDNGSGDQSTGSDEVVGDQDQRSRAVSDTIADVIVCETDSGVKVSGINIVNEGHLVDGVGSDFPTVGDHINVVVLFLILLQMSLFVELTIRCN